MLADITLFENNVGIRPTGAVSALSVFNEPYNVFFRRNTGDWFTQAHDSLESIVAFVDDELSDAETTERLGPALNHIRTNVAEALARVNKVRKLDFSLF